MKELNRRSVIVNTLALAAVTTALTPDVLSADSRSTLPIVGTTPVETLEKLAAEGKYANVDLAIPHDVLGTDLNVEMAGVDTRDYPVLEVYAPGDDSGWAVVYDSPERKRNNRSYLLTKIIHGNWSISRG